jgi:hypothetical protein
VAACASINSVLAFALTIARATAPVVAAALRTATGNYRLVMAAVAVSSLAASLALGRGPSVPELASAGGWLTACQTAVDQSGLM